MGIVTNKEDLKATDMDQAIVKLTQLLDEVAPGTDTDGIKEKILTYMREDVSFKTLRESFGIWKKEFRKFELPYKETLQNGKSWKATAEKIPAMRAAAFSGLLATPMGVEIVTDPVADIDNCQSIFDSTITSVIVPGTGVTIQKLCKIQKWRWRRGRGIMFLAARQYKYGTDYRYYFFYHLVELILL